MSKFKRLVQVNFTGLSQSKRQNQTQIDKSIWQIAVDDVIAFVCGNKRFALMLVPFENVFDMTGAVANAYEHVDAICQQKAVNIKQLGEHKGENKECGRE